MTESHEAHVRRLEHVWAGDFGDRYMERNQGETQDRGRFWTEFLRRYPVSSVLEVGSNIGLNLDWASREVSEGLVVGVDVSETALLAMRQRLPGVPGIRAVARCLPIRDGTFDLVFTAGVLIHQPPAALGQVMSEIVRCSRRYVLCLEYFAPIVTEVPYRSQPSSLFKLDFGAKYAELFPSLGLVFRTELPFDIFVDDTTAWLFERT